MWRFLAGAAASFLLLTGAFLFWQSRAAESAKFPAAPAPGGISSLFGGSGQPLEAPEASVKTREQKRFSRYDKNKDGKVEADEYLAARHRNFDKLDVDHNDALSFQEYAAKGIDKFNAAGGRKGFLTEAEFATTAPPQTRHKTCSCGRPEQAAPPQLSDNNDD